MPVSLKEMHVDRQSGWLSAASLGLILAGGFLMTSQVVWWAGLLMVVSAGWMAYRARLMSHPSSPSRITATLALVLGAIILILWSGFLLIAG